MILIDMTQLVVSNIMVNMEYKGSEKLDEGMIRHMVLDSLRNYNVSFGRTYGKIVICCDSKMYWRRTIFPLYKHSRKKEREKSPFDWNLIFETIGKMKAEINEHLPYKVIEVEGAEADDVIAVLTETFHHQEPILIVSTDKDFVQLQKYKNVTQYSPILKRFVQVENPTDYVKEHIIRGDRGDGIPNILSADNVFAIGERQKSIMKVKLAEWIHQEPTEFCSTPEMVSHYERNKVLVDFDYIPTDLKENIISHYKEQCMVNNPKQKMFTYFIEKGLRHLMEKINEF